MLSENRIGELYAQGAACQQFGKKTFVLETEFFCIVTE